MAKIFIHLLLLLSSALAQKANNPNSSIKNNNRPEVSTLNTSNSTSKSIPEEIPSRQPQTNGDGNRGRGGRYGDGKLSTINPSYKVQFVFDHDGVEQIPVVKPRRRGGLGYYSRILDTRGHPRISPLAPSTVGPLSEVSVPLKRFVNDEVLDVGSAMPLEKRQSVSDIFTPISTSAPLTMFPRTDAHPVSNAFVVPSGGGVAPLQTNKFYANMFLENRNRPVFTMPYELWFSNQATDTVWGLSFDHREPSQRDFGPPDPVTGASRYYINPIYIRSLSFSATEFDISNSTMQVRNPGTASADAVFLANGGGKMTVPMCLGMGFVSAEVEQLTPLLVSDVLFANLTLVTYAGSGALAAPGAVKYQVTLTSGVVWNIYAFPTTASGSLTLEITGEGRIEARAPFTGLLQAVKVSNTSVVDLTVETAYDQAAGSYCKSVSVSAQTAGSTGRYQFSFVNAGPGSSAVLMFAFPHHVSSFETSTAARMIPTLRMASPTKGTMTAVLADQWRMVEPDMPTNILWLPVKSGSAATFTAAKLTRMMECARYEISQDFATLSNLDSMYFSGKVLAKFAFVCLTTSDVLRDYTLARTCLAKMKTAFDRFRQNRQTYKLVYDRKWRGLISEAGIRTGDPLRDFGSSYYNDHHFHYAYHIQSAAIIAYLDKKLLSGSWLAANRDWVNTLVRDVANPSALDGYYPVFRAFDWFHGHSWAKGLFESSDGKDEESSSEDYNFAYSMKMWGRVISDSAMEARGNLMLAVLKRSINAYMLLANGNSNHPREFVGNRVSGILFENKVDHTTYFGQNIEYIHGIHMLPLTAISPYMRPRTFVQQEWDQLFKTTVDTIRDGWRGILYANYAMLAPSVSFSFFAQSGFSANLLDGGASRTWYLAFAGALGGGT